MPIGACLRRISELLVESSCAHMFLNHLISSNVSTQNEESIFDISRYVFFGQYFGIQVAKALVKYLSGTLRSLSFLSQMTDSINSMICHV